MSIYQLVTDSLSANLITSDKIATAAIQGYHLDSANVTTSNVTEGSNLYYTNARARTAISVAGAGTYDNVTGIITVTGDVTAADLTTANVVELTNLYFTYDRARDALAGNTISIGELTVSGNLFVLGDTVEINTSTLTIEDKNILLANGAINAAAADGAGITVDGAQANIVYLNSIDKWSFNKPLDVNGDSVLTSANTTTDISEGLNLYYTNARARTAISVAGAGTYDNITGVITITGDVTTEDLTTANVVELNNLYYTNTRVESYVSTLGYALSSDLTTANIVELTNLYFTNARAIGAFTAGQGIIIEANGQIVANVTGGGGGGASVTVANSAPSTPSEGDLYFDNELLKLFIYYEDDDSNQWIEASPTATSNPFEFQKAVGATAVEIYRFDKNLYRSGKFWITANSDPSYKYEEIAVIHDGANVEIAQSIYPQVEINNDPNSELRYFNADYIQPSGEYTFNAVAIAYSANIISSNVIVYGRALGGSPILSGEVKLIRT